MELWWSCMTRAGKCSSNTHRKASCYTSDERYILLKLKERVPSHAEPLSNYLYSPSVGRRADCLQHVWATKCKRFWNTAQPSLPQTQLPGLTTTNHKLWASSLGRTPRNFYSNRPLLQQPRTMAGWISRQRSKSQEWSPEMVKNKSFDYHNNPQLIDNWQ